MLTKYNLFNVRKGGVDHLVDGRRWSINDKLTDDQADFLINAGLGKYFRLKPKGNVKSQTSTSATSGTASAGPISTSGASAAPTSTDATSANATSGTTSAGN